MRAMDAGVCEWHERVRGTWMYPSGVSKGQRGNATGTLYPRGFGAPS